MNANFGDSLEAVLAHEGGWANHPRDPGGATMRGVTQRVYDAYRRRRRLPVRSVRSITTPELHAIYRRQYWDVVRGDELPAGVDLAVFDAAVNSGPVRAAKWLQRAVGVTADGVIGLVTLGATTEQPLARTVHRICDDRLHFLRGLTTWRTFGKGWSRRVAAVRQQALRVV